MRKEKEADLTCNSNATEEENNKWNHKSTSQEEDNQKHSWSNQIQVSLPLHKNINGSEGLNK